MSVKKLPPSVNVFQKYGKSAHDAQWDKSRVLIKVIDNIVGIDSFDQKYVIIKGLLQSELLKQHLVIIVVYQSLSNSALYRKRCFENTKKLQTGWKM